MSMTVADLQERNGQKKKDLSEMGPKQQVRHLLNQNAKAIKEALPKHLNHERLLKVAQTAATSTPELLDCHVPSLLGAIVQCATLGLEPNTVMGQAYLLPFRNNKARRQDVQVVVGYKGLIDLARRSGQIVSIAAHAVRENDYFEFKYGLDEKLDHIPVDGDRGEITHFYAYAKLVGGGHAFEVMTVQQVKKIAAATQSRGQKGPWRDHFEEMGRKTAVRRLCKWLPMSVDLASAAALDEKAEAGENQALDGVLEGEFNIMAEPAEEAPAEEAPAEEGSEEGPAIMTDGQRAEVSDFLDK